MTSNEWLEEVTAAACRVVDRMWVGHFELAAVRGNDTVRGLLDHLFRSVTAATAALNGTGDETGMPFVYGWVPSSEFRLATAQLAAAARRATPDDDTEAQVRATATELLRLTIDLADTIGTSYGPTRAMRDAATAAAGR